MKRNGIAVLAGALTCAGLGFADGVRFEEGTVTLPTYAPGGYDKTPIFYTGRVYQGAQGRVYPYPMQDVLFDGKVDETYKYLTLENEWLSMGLLPEHGGHMLNFTDRKSGFEIFYRQHVVKPALIGMLGAWISGGVEWNFPHHHRATTAMPIDWRMTERNPAEPSDFACAAGTKTVWIGETELRRRLKWTIGLSMMPDRAVLEAENIFMNRGPFIESMIYWANVSVHCGDDYQILFPPSCHLGFDHHKNYWTSFPIGPRKEEVELLPSQRSKYADDISGTMDLSWWKNFTIESRSIFAMDPDNAWLAGFDHKRQMGTAHVSNRHITVGKKFFLWGNFSEAHVWDTVLTDHDGPYLELMVGCWSDNQPDYSWIAPYETRKVKQFWFPVKGIGGVKNVTVDGAVNVERRGKEELLVGFHSTRVLSNCTVRVANNSVDPESQTDSSLVFCERCVSLDPNTPWCRMVKVDGETKDQELTASIADASGKVFLSYTPVGPDPHDPLPPKVENPKEPKEYASAELAYEVGLRLEQFHNGILDPEPYYRRALEIDPDYTRANLALGLRALKNGAYGVARPYLEKAVKRATQNHTRALDADPEYYLALCYRGLGDTWLGGPTSEPDATEFYKRAEDLFWRCTWRQTHKKEAFFEIVRICCLQRRYREAHDILEFNVLPIGADEAKFHTLHAYLHRKLKDCPEAEPLHRANWKTFATKNQERAFACDPLEYWGVVEATFREHSGASTGALDGSAALAKAEKNRGLKAQQLMECVCDYFGIGAWKEVYELCHAAMAKAAKEKPYATEGALPLKDTLAACDSYKNPMFAYFAAFAATHVDLFPVNPIEELKHAAKLSGDYCFPSRIEELAVLKWAELAVRQAGQQAYDNKIGANTCYYLGEILWNMDQKDAAIAAWKKAVGADPKHALALRCLGFALSHPGTYFTNTGVPNGIPSKEAYDWYLKALEADPGNFRTLDEAGKLAERLKLPAKERLALMLKYKDACGKYDANMLRLAYCYNAVGEYAKAHEILTTRRFHVWEGADGLLAPFVESCIGLGQQAMAKNDYKTALKYFEESTTYPANLQAGRPGDAGTEPKSRYFMAQCKKHLGDEAGYRAELEKSLKGWIHAGEMDYWRVKALRELGREAECAPLIAELKQAIRELEAPPPTVINAYAKFAGENSAMERAAKAREKAGALKKLLDELLAVPPSAREADRLSPADWVRPEIGTDFNGHVNPGATYPFGMLQPGPDTGKEGWDYCGGYRWQDKEIIGFTQTHLFGTGCSDLGDYRLMPYVGARRTGEPFPGDFKSDYRKETEVRQCGYYAVSLDRNGVRVETTVAPHAAVYRFTALKDGPLHVVFDDYFGLNGKMNEQIRAATLTLGADRRSLRGTKTRKNWVERTTSFVLEFDRPWTSSAELAKVVPDQVPKRYDFTFGAKRGDVLTVKFAISFVSEDGAEANLRREIPAWDFDAVRASARAAWNQVLSRAKVRGPVADCEKFYTSLYHAFVQPVNIADVDGRYRGADDKVAVAPGGTYYSTFSFWDTYRAAHPLYTVLAPERVPGMVASIVAHGKAAGFLPIWTLCGKDNQCMIGTHSIPVLVDAVRKGLAAGTDEREAMRLVRDTLTRRHPGRVKEHWDELEKHGYYPFDRVYPESVSRLVEVAFDDWCAAQLATRVGDAESARHFARRAENWKNVVDPETGFLRGRDSKGNWRTPFSPFALGRWGDPNNDYTEGNAWQWTWHVLHDPLGLVRALGGRDQALRKLDALFVQPEKTADSGECGDVTGLIGQYAHGNEPSHHVAYLYRYLGRPDRTAEVVREICTKLYTNRPDGICGNEDCGQMSAWYVFSALGFYPFNPASGEYVLGAPQVEEAVLDVGGKTFVVLAKGLSERAKYVKSVTLNGSPLAGFTLTHDQLRAGGELVFEMRE